MCRSAISLPMLRLPECSISHTWPSSSDVSSMKWLPPPSEPICCFALRSRSCTSSCSAPNAPQNRSQPANRPWLSLRRRTSGIDLCAEKPTGIACSTARRSACRSSGRSAVVRLVRTACMPQPMSTPTAAGDTALRIATTEPTVAPLPRWTSGITRRPCTHGSREMLRSWSSACCSTSSTRAHIRVSACAPGRRTGSASVSMVSILLFPPGSRDGRCATSSTNGEHPLQESNLRPPRS